MISPLLVLEHLTTSPPLALNGAGGEDRMIRLLVKAIPLITTILLIACGSNTPVDSEQEGRILLWHQWSGADEETLNELLDMFNEVYPEITVISISHTSAGLKESFIDAATRGFGPDVMIGSQLWTPELADAQLIRPVGRKTRSIQNLILTQRLIPLRYQDELVRAAACA